MAKLCIISDKSPTITINLKNVDIARHVLIQGDSMIRICLASGIEDLIPMPDVEAALTVANAIFKYIDKEEDTKFTITLSHDVDSELMELFQEDKKIQAIKRYRTIFGVGLKEAKMEVEEMLDVYRSGGVVTYPAHRTM